MFDPIAVTGTAALAESVKFLHSQLTAIVRHCPSGAASASSSDTILMPTAPAGALDRPLVLTRVATTELVRLVDRLRSTDRVLAEYADGRKAITLVDGLLLESAADARALLEGLYKRYLTFTGETRRPATGTALSVAEVAARTAGLAAPRSTPSGQRTA